MAGSERSNSRQPPWEPEQEADKVSFGTWLRRQREIREIPLREIADTTKISLRYLEALEQDRFDVLPAPVFAKGFLREYSRYVGLDPDEVVNSFINAQTRADDEESEAAPSRARTPKAPMEWASGLILALAVVALLGLVAGLILWTDRRGGDEAPPPPIAAPPVRVAPEPAPPVEAPPEAEPQPSAPLVVTMDFQEDCWVESEVDGQRRLSELRVQGESVTLEAEERILLTLGNPGGVRLEVNGSPFDPGLDPGRVARDVLIDLDTARALVAPQ